MRTVSTAAMALLVITALFWGNCFSCPRMIVAQTAHHCCKHVKIDCGTQSLRDYVKTDMPDAPVVMAVVAPAPVFEERQLEEQSNEPAPVLVLPPLISPLRI